MINLHETAKSCIRIADAHGFDTCTWENLPTKLMFVVSEIEEACEAMESMDGHTNYEVGEELADIGIRTMVMIETLWPDWSTGRIEQRKLQNKTAFMSPQRMLWPMLRYAVGALSSWRIEERKDAQQSLELLLLELWRVGDRMRIDLDGFVQLKMDKNEKRPMLNGKKRSEG